MWNAYLFGDEGIVALWELQISHSLLQPRCLSVFKDLYAYLGILNAAA